MSTIAEMKDLLTNESEPMRAKALSISHPLFFVISLAATTVLADSHRPTCDEKPSLRDCVRVENPNAPPPKQIVREKGQPNHPTVTPLPAPGPGTGGGTTGN